MKTITLTQEFVNKHFPELNFQYVPCIIDGEEFESLGDYKSEYKGMLIVLTTVSCYTTRKYDLVVWNSKEFATSKESEKADQARILVSYCGQNEKILIERLRSVLN